MLHILHKDKVMKILLDLQDNNNKSLLLLNPWEINQRIKEWVSVWEPQLIKVWELIQIITLAHSVNKSLRKITLLDSEITSFQNTQTSQGFALFARVYQVVIQTNKA
jgi:hypothetical protein